MKTMLFALFVESIVTVLATTEQESEIQRARKALESYTAAFVDAAIVGSDWVENPPRHQSRKSCCSEFFV
jgi:hypothetical protein